VAQNDAIPMSPRVVERLEGLGVSVERARARASKELGAQVPAPPAPMTTDEFFAFWRAVDVETAKRPDIGLLLGAESGARGYSVASTTAIQAPNLGEAVKALARYKRLACPELVSIDVAGGEVSVQFHWTLATSQVPRLIVDSTFSSFAALAQRGTAGKVSPLRIELARRRAGAAHIREHFDCRVVFGAAVDRIVFAVRDLAVPFVTSDVAAFSRMVPGLEAELVGRHGSKTLRDELRVAIARCMSSGMRPSVDVVAKRLHVSPRTLQRRLGEANTSYQEQLDEVRRFSARRLLTDTELEPFDIAFLLGFEEPNSFARAFRGWERTTPARFRENAVRA